MYLAVCVAVVAAALAAHERWLRPAQRARPSDRGWSASAPAAPAAASRPLEMTTQALADVGLEKLTEPPADAVLPAGAAFSHAFRRSLPDGATDSVSCVAAIDVEAAAAFYRTALAGQGYRLMRNRPGLAGVEMLFVKDMKEYYRVGLRPADNGKRVRIELVIWRPAGRP